MPLPTLVRATITTAAVCAAGCMGPMLVSSPATARSLAPRFLRVTPREGRMRTRPAPSPQLVWSDEFNGPAGASPDPTKWQAQVGGDGWGNDELESYTDRPANASLDGQGHLAITARAENYTGPDGITRAYTSARLQTKGLFQTQYGTIEARIKLPQGAGLWPAFWALGSDIDTVDWPNCGEIDVMENLGSDPFTIYGSIHGPQPGAPDGQYGLTAAETSSVSLAAGYHVYGVTWSPAQIAFTLDGTTYSVRTLSALVPGQQWVFNQPFYLLLNLAVGGDWPGAPTASTTFPATMLVDWVRVYSS